MKLSHPGPKKQFESQTGDKTKIAANRAALVRRIRHEHWGKNGGDIRKTVFVFARGGMSEQEVRDIVAHKSDPSEMD